MDSSLDKEIWPVFHWDTARRGDFNEKFMKFYIKEDIRYYENQIEKIFYNDCALKKAMNEKMIGIYNLVIKQILSKDDAQKCLEMLIREYYSNQ